MPSCPKCRVPRRCRLQCGIKRQNSKNVSCGEESSFCLSLGKFGLTGCDKRRVKIMSFAWILSVLEVLLSLCSLAAVGTQKHTVTHLAWTIGESETQELYVGLEALVLKAESTTQTMLFVDEDCINDYCDFCHNSSSMTVFLVTVCFFLTIPPVVITYKRASRRRDQNVHKFWGMVFPFFGLVLCITALTNFLDGCYYHLPQADALHDDIAWVVGPGSICLLLSLFLKPIDIIMHMVLPVVKEDPLLDDGFQGSSFELPS